MPMVRLAVACLLLAAFPTFAAEHTVVADDDFFEPKELTIEAGDTVTWVNQGSAARPHNVVADDGDFRCADGCEGVDGTGNPSGAAWEFSLTFDDPDEIPYHCENHGLAGGVGMAGTLTVEPKQDDGPAINFGHTGSWFNPETDGQGFLVDVVVAQDPPLVFLYWFTFDTMAGGVEAQRWFTAIGNADADQPNRAVLDVRITTGGVFDASPPDPDTEVVGTAVIEFESCTDGTLTYDINLEGDDAQQVMGEIPITRLTPDVRCEQLAGADG